MKPSCNFCRQIPGQAGVARQAKIDKANKGKLEKLVGHYSSNAFAEKLTKAVHAAKKKSLRKSPPPSTPDPAA